MIVRPELQGAMILVASSVARLNPAGTLSRIMNGRLLGTAARYDPVRHRGARTQCIRHTEHKFPQKNAKAVAKAMAERDPEVRLH